MKSKQQKYDEAVERNLGTFGHREKSKKLINSGDVNILKVKRHIGIRDNDTSFDGKLAELLPKLQLKKQ